MFTVEMDILGLTHQDIGAALATKWQLPDMLLQVIGLHHKPDDDGGTDMVHLIQLADVCCKQMGFAFEEKPTELPLHEATLEKLGMDAEEILSPIKDQQATVVSQVNDTFSAIFK